MIFTVARRYTFTSEEKLLKRVKNIINESDEKKHTVLCRYYANTSTNKLINNSSQRGVAGLTVKRKQFL